MAMPPTLSAVAKRSGVAVSTASAILRDEPTCFASATTRRRVLRAAEELNYRRNPLALALRTGRSGMIGVLLPGIAGGPSVFAEKLQTLESLACQVEYRLIFATHQNDMALAMFHLDDFAARYVEGMVICPPRVTEQEARPLARWLDQASVPVVTMESHLDLAACDVSVDRDAGGYLQVKHLLDIGCRRLAFVMLGTRANSVQGRIRGYRRALNEAGMTMEQHLYLSTPMDAEMEVGRRLIADAIQAGQRFDGVVAVSDLVAAGVMCALDDAGLRIPRDVKVIGFDDDVFAPGLLSPLTSIRQPRHSGRLAFERLYQYIEKPEQLPNARQKDRILLAPELVIRRSTQVLSPAAP